MRPVLIIGGGISGLSAAYYLAKSGVRSTIVDRRPRLGGVMITDTVQGCVIEGGPDSFLAAKPAAMELIRELGMESEVIGSNDSARVTYIQRDGRLIPMPDGLMMMIPARIGPVLRSPLLGWGTKLRMGLDSFRRPFERPERSVAAFVRDHYGQEAVDYLAEPLLAGVYGGNPERLSASAVLPRMLDYEREYGSLTRGVLAARAKAPAESGPLFRTLKRGMGSLIPELERRAQPELLHGEAEAIDRASVGWRVRVHGEWIDADHVIAACPAYEAARLVASLDPALSGLLAGVEYGSSMTVALGYRRATLGHPLNGFGFLVPARERRRLVACTWVGTKFHHRVPDDMAILRCFFGGVDDPDVLGEADDSVTAMARDEVRAMMGVTAEPAFAKISRWPRSMAQYAVGHSARVREIEGRASTLPGLWLTGNAYQGIGVPDCIRLAREAAAKIITRK